MAQTPWRVRVIVSAYREPRPRGRVDPARWVLRLAQNKAREVARRYPLNLVLGADTIVFHGGKIVGKPRSQKDAHAILSKLSARWHKVYTGVSLLKGRKFEAAHVSVTRVKMKKLSPRALDFWSRRNHDKAGAYAAQGRGNPFVEKVRGEFDNVVGLPLKGVRRLLNAARKKGWAPERKA
jgi:septum formation protein